MQIRCPRPRDRGRRESRVPTAPAVSCAKRTVIGAHEHTGSAETARLSPRNGFTAYFVLSPVSGLFATVTPEKLASQELSASVAAPGPHDFAVRLRSVVLHARACLKQRRPSHSGPTHRDDRETPLGWAGMAEVIILISRIVKRNIFDS